MSTAPMDDDRGTDGRRGHAGAMAGLVARLSSAVSGSSRAQKLDWLQERIPAGSSILLVGVSALLDGDRLGTQNFVERGLADHGDAVALIYEDEGGPGFEVEVVRGSALDLPFEDGTFDYVVSNAVIEHVGGPAPARQMVLESRRVARKAVFHTTPYRWFPVETHTQVPLLHWLPRRLQQRAFRVVRRPWFNGQDFWLFSRRGLRALSPDCTIGRAGLVSIIGEWGPKDR